MRMLWKIVAVFTALAAPATALAVNGPKPLFASDDMIHVTIKGPIGKITEDRTNATRAAALSVVGAAPETLAITLAARGITRRSADVCAFPPLRVVFTAKPGESSLFRGQKTLKLVTHCQPDAVFQQYLQIEYSVYRMYALLTPLTLRARLATVDYVDERGRVVVSRLGFFLEDTDDAAKRNALVEVKAPERIPKAALIAEDAGRVAMFEYMIGNLDWAMNAGPKGDKCCHNVRLTGATPDAAANLVPIPYDFDFSGLVDAPYAGPPEGIKLANVRIRQYRGFCANNPAAIAAAADIVAKHAAILEVLTTLPQLGDFSRRKASNYLESFFRDASTPEGLQKLMRTCI